MAQSRQLDIAIVTMQFPVASETFISGRLRALHQMGHSMKVFALRREPPGARELRRERAVDRIPTSHNGLGRTVAGVLQGLGRPKLLASSIGWIFSRNLRRPAHLVRALGVLPRAFDILSQVLHDQPDVVHLEWGHYPVVLAYLIQDASPSTVISVSLIAYDLNTEFGGTVDVVRAADVVRTQAAINVEQIMRFTGVEQDRIAVIYDGVDVTRLDRMTNVIEKVPGRVVVAGRLVREKGVTDAMRVFAAALRSAPFATLRILGEGPERSKLEHLAAELGVTDAVEFLGHISHEQVLREFGKASVLLHLSHTERLPNVVKEAMVCECVPITTNTEGIEELVEHGVTGFVVEQGDLAPTADLLSQVLNGVVNTEEMTAAGRNFICRNFDHQVNIEKLVGLWREALRGQEHEFQVA